MRTAAIILTVQCLTAVMAWAQGADEVIPFSSDKKGAGIPFIGVTVTDFNKDYKLEFSDGTKNYSKPISEIRQIKLKSSDAFTKAEDMSAKGDEGAKVVEQYKKASGSMSGAWQKRLLQIRRLMAAGSSGMVGTAVEDWVSLAKASNKYDAAILALVPKTVGMKGSEENKKAIDILKVNAESSNANFKKLVTELLVNLLNAEGRTDEALRYVSGGQPQNPDPGNGGTQTPVVTNAVVSLTAVNTFFTAKKYDDCIAQVKAGLKNFSDRDLPEALYILAECQFIKGTASKDQSLLSEAGLNFMRVYTFYDASPRAGEALLKAGIVCSEIGNKKAALSAFSKVMDRFQNNDDLVKQAQENIAKLNK